MLKIFHVRSFVHPTVEKDSTLVTLSLWLVVPLKLFEDLELESIAARRSDGSCLQLQCGSFDAAGRSGMSAAGGELQTIFCFWFALLSANSHCPGESEDRDSGSHDFCIDGRKRRAVGCELGSGQWRRDSIARGGVVTGGPRETATAASCRDGRGWEGGG